MGPRRKSRGGQFQAGGAPPREPRWGRGGAEPLGGCWLQSPRSRRPARSRPRGSSGARRRGRPEAMAAHGKLRRERGLQAEYEAQVKGERASGAPSSVPRRAPKVVGEPENSLRGLRVRCSSPPAPPPTPRPPEGLDRGRERARAHSPDPEPFARFSAPLWSQPRAVSPFFLPAFLWLLCPPWFSLHLTQEPE